MTQVTAGRVGRPHGLDGSFYVEQAQHPLAPGTTVSVGGRKLRVVRRAGMNARPLVRLSGLDDPDPLRGAPLLVEQELAADEWLACDLTGCTVIDRGVVARVLAGPSCSLLELEDGSLIPFVADAVQSVDLVARTIVVDLEFLGDADAPRDR